MPDTVDTSKITIDSTFSMAASTTPSEDQSIFAFNVGTNGKPIRGSQGWYSIKLLIQTLGAVATAAEQGALDAKTAALAAQSACEAALAAIGSSDTEGLRGRAVTAITTAKTAALAAIGESDTAGARGSALTAIATALMNALASIGQTDDAGARGSALSAIAAALNAALAAIGQTDNEGARKAALDAVSTAKANALSAIGESDTTGARGDAIEAINALYSTISQAITSANTAWDSKVSSDNSAFDSKVSTANTTIDQKVAAASESATNAASSEALAEKWATEDEDVPVEGSGDTAKYSAYHWMKKAEAAANVPVATQTTAGKVYISNSLDDVSGEDKTKTAVDKAVAQALRNMFMGYKATIGDGSTLTFTVTHNLGTQDIMPMIGGDSVPEWSLSTTDSNTATLTFTEAPATSSITVLILPVRTNGGGE